MLFPGVVAGGSDYIRGTSNSGVVPFELLGKTGRYIQCLNGQDASRGSSKLYAPQYVIGGSWRSAISIVNLESRAGKVTLRLAGEDGTTIATRTDLPLPARGKLWVADQNFFLNPGSSVVQGHVEIASDGLALSGSVVFSDSDRAVFSSALPLVSTLHGSFTFGQIASDETYFTGIAILNPSENAVSALVEIFDRLGARIAATRETIPPGGRRSRLLTEYFPGIRGESHRAGYVRCRRTGQSPVLPCLEPTIYPRCPRSCRKLGLEAREGVIRSLLQTDGFWTGVDYPCMASIRFR